MEKEKIIIANAQPHQASDIASLIMLAMNHDCCRYFAGPNHTLNDFHQLMTRLVLFFIRLLLWMIIKSLGVV